MNVCLFSDDRNVRSAHIRRLFPGLAERGLEVHVVCHKPAELPGATVECYRVPPAGPANLRRWHGRQTRYLRGFLRRFDVVNVHFLHDWGFTPQIIADGCFVASPWGSDIVPPPGERPPAPPLVELRKSLLRSAACVTAVGPTFARMVARFAGLDEDRIDVVPFGVDLNLFRPARHAPSEMVSSGIVGFFKGFREVYGPKVLLRAIPIVLDALPGAGFELVGDGAQLDECRALAVELGIEPAIRWIPRQPNHRMPEHLARWDVTVIPSFCESFGVAALEASAMCIPVIASDVGGLRDTVIDGETGWLIPPNQPAALAAAIIDLLENPALRRRMGLAGRAFVERQYDLQAAFQKWLRLYETALERSSVMV